MCLKKKKKKSQSRAVRFDVFTQMKLGNDRMKIRADLTHVNGAICFLHSSLVADGLSDSEMDKSALKMATVRVVPFQSGTSNLYFL